MFGIVARITTIRATKIALPGYFNTKMGYFVKRLSIIFQQIVNNQRRNMGLFAEKNAVTFTVVSINAARFCPEM
jgi:hypothetical protein